MKNEWGNEECPAFPLVGEDYTWRNTGLSNREYASIHLRVPDSGSEIIDRMIRCRIRDDFAAQFMAARMINQHPNDICDSVDISRAYRIVDAMIAHSEAARSASNAEITTQPSDAGEG